MINFILNLILGIVFSIIIGLSSAFGIYYLNSTPSVLPSSFESDYKKAKENLCFLDSLKHQTEHSLAPKHEQLLMEAVVIAKDKNVKEC